MSDETYAWVWEEEEISPHGYTGSRPPTTLGAIVNRKGKFDKFKVVDVTSGWRSIRLVRIDDKQITETVSWDQFHREFEERYFT